MREILGRTLHDMAQALESAEGSEGRTIRVLDLLQRIVPYEQCALLSTQPGREPRLFVLPATRPDVQAKLSETLIHLHVQLVDERLHPPDARAKRHWETHLAVPLVRNDETVGVLFVSGASPDRSGPGYTEQHLRELSIVGAHLAGYLVMVDQARALDEERPLAGIRVLLVDDDDDLRSATKTILEKHGAEVTDVSSAAAALAALERSRPHVLLSDISMPGETGYDLMRKIVARDAALPAAALTSLTREEDRKRAHAAGFRMHLAKPIDAQALVTAVATLTGRRLTRGSAAPLTD